VRRHSNPTLIRAASHTRPSTGAASAAADKKQTARNENSVVQRYLPEMAQTMQRYVSIDMAGGVFWAQVGRANAMRQMRSLNLIDYSNERVVAICRDAASAAAVTRVAV